MALFVFVVVVLIDAAGLFLDGLIFLVMGQPYTLAAYVRKHWLAGVPIIGLQFVGVVSLALHFWG